MATKSSTPAEITNFGGIAKLTGPAGWILQGSKPEGVVARSVRTIHAPGEREVAINAFYRGAPVDEQTAQKFADIIKKKPAKNGPEKLNAEEIKNLRDVMGTNTVGDNQFTNPAKKGSPDYHVFHMDQAETVSINGKTVLKVLGVFQDDEGEVETEYEGLFYTAESQPLQIEEIYFQSPTKAKFGKYQPDWEHSLQTIEWLP